jgi:hypothetical protein
MVVVVAFLAGCSTMPTRAYNGPELPAAQVAKISAFNKQYTLWNRPQYVEKLTLRALDGEALDHAWWADYPCDVFVLPGQHEILARISSQGGGFLPTLIADNINSKWITPLIFKAEAGKSYMVYAEIIRKPEGQKLGFLESRGMWVYWVEDAATGKVICGKHPEISDTFANESATMVQHDYSPKK